MNLSTIPTSISDDTRIPSNALSSYCNDITILRCTYLPSSSSSAGTEYRTTTILIITLEIIIVSNSNCFLVVIMLYEKNGKILAKLFPDRGKYQIIMNIPRKISKCNRF